MMRIFISLLLFILIAMEQQIHAADSFYLDGLDAQAYAEANDLDQASARYERLLKQTLPEWQRSIVLYNLGTVKLRQQQYQAALDLYQRIQEESISSPWLLRDLKINQGISRLYLAKSLSASRTDSPDLLNILESSIRNLNTGDVLDCFIQRVEKIGAPLDLCETSSSLLEPLTAAHQQSMAVKLKIYQEMAQSDIAVQLLLIQGMDQLSHYLKNGPLSKDQVTFFHEQAETLLPLWDALKQTSFDPLKKSYQEAITKIQKDTSTDASKALQLIITQLKTIAKPQPIDSLLLNMLLLVNSEPISSRKITALIEEQKTITEEDKKEALVHSEISLKKSLSMNDLEKAHQARFYLSAALNEVLLSLKKDQLSDPISILEKALNKARSALQLNYLYQLIPYDERIEEMSKIVLSAQTKVPESVTPFINAVLKQEQENFKKQACQKTPWDKAIPLFDTAVKAAQVAVKQLAHHPLMAEAALLSQTETIRHWKEVLNMIKNPPSSSNQSEQESKDNPQPIKDAPSNPDETLRLLQEMQLQDQPGKSGLPKDLHSW